MTEAESVGDYLKKLRRVAGLTLRDVEARTNSNVKNGYLSQVETGHIQRPAPATLWHLAEVYGVDYNQLLVRAGHRAPSDGMPVDVLEGVPLSAIAELNEEDKADLREFIEFLTTRRRHREPS